MNYIVETLGLALPMVSKRRAVMMGESKTSSRTATNSAIMCKSGSCASFDKYRDDDETASTVSSYDDSTSSIGSVSFAGELVTEVYVRPVTTLQEKRELYYTERDYRRFRQEYFMEQACNARPRAVSFAPKMVTNVHSYSVGADRDNLYYSNDDLQRFLDDFLSSLNKPWRARW
jgi:hypothetical protein